MATRISGIADCAPAKQTNDNVKLSWKTSVSHPMRLAMMDYHQPCPCHVWCTVVVQMTLLIGETVLTSKGACLAQVRSGRCAAPLVALTTRWIMKSTTSLGEK